MQVIFIWIGVICVSVGIVFASVILLHINDNYLNDKIPVQYRPQLADETVNENISLLDILQDKYLAFIQRNQDSAGEIDKLKNALEQVDNDEKNYLMAVIMHIWSDVNIQENATIPSLNAKFLQIIKAAKKKPKTNHEATDFLQIIADIAIFNTMVMPPSTTFSGLCKLYKNSRDDGGISSRSFADTNELQVEIDSVYKKTLQNKYLIDVWFAHYPDQMLDEAMNEYDVDVLDRFLKSR